MDSFELFTHGMLYKRPDLLPYLIGRDAAQALRQKRELLFNKVVRETWNPALALFRQLEEPHGSGFSVVDGVVCCGNDETNVRNEETLSRLIPAILPWRRGPWRIASHEIDSEWRSDLKFDSLSELHGQFKDKSILDIGSSNGYYAARLKALGASSVLSLDPSEIVLLQFELFQKFAKQETLQLELLGFQDAPALGQVFDVVFCMGVLYHHRSPLAVLEACRAAMRPGAMLVLESMTYPSKESVSFFPPDRYAKARNVYFLPSATALVSMCQRSGFKNVEILNERSVLITEQRKTRLAPYESLAEFLDPHDHTKTVEGWPAPQRALVVAYS